MTTKKIRQIASRVCDDLEINWATPFAFVIYSHPCPSKPSRDSSAKCESLAEEISAENASFCEKLNIKQGTDKIQSVPA